jgi:hypothetical protein
LNNAEIRKDKNHGTNSLWPPSLILGFFFRKFAELVDINSDHRSKIIISTSLEAIIYLIFLAAFWFLFSHLPYATAHDIEAHTLQLLLFLEHGSFPVPPGYAFLSWMFSGFSYDPGAISGAGALVMAIATVGKFIILHQIFKSCLNQYPRGTALSWVLAFALMLITPLYSLGEYFYFGRIAITTWHNPTTIAVTPFALLLFLATPGFLQNPGRNTFRILLLVVLNLLFKPSFLFAWIPGCFLFAIITTGVNKRLIKVFWPLLLAGGLIMVQYAMIYITGNLDELIYNSRPVGILLRPFRVWNHFTKMGNISLVTGILTSFALPLIFIAFYARSKSILPLTWLAFTIMIFALTFSWMLAEGGVRFHDGNFLWTSWLANLMLFLAVVINMLHIQTEEYKKLGVLWTVLALHLLSGIGYIINIFVTGYFG